MDHFLARKAAAVRMAVEFVRDIVHDMALSTFQMTDIKTLQTFRSTTNFNNRFDEQIIELNVFVFVAIMAPKMRIY
jgi:hypothetical protein